MSGIITINLFQYNGSNVMGSYICSGRTSVGPYKVVGPVVWVLGIVMGEEG